MSNGEREIEREERSRLWSGDYLLTAAQAAQAVSVAAYLTAYSKSESAANHEPTQKRRRSWSWSWSEEVGAVQLEAERSRRG